MNVIVKHRFRDKTTGKIRNVGEGFTCSKARYDEIMAAGDYVEAVEVEKTESAPKKAAKKK